MAGGVQVQLQAGLGADTVARSVDLLSHGDGLLSGCGALEMRLTMAATRVEPSTCMSWASSSTTLASLVMLEPLMLMLVWFSTRS